MLNWATAILCFVLYIYTAPVYADNTAKELSILRITPSGEDVPTARQVIIEFNRPVVPLGRMERSAAETGVEINPPLNCQWRWINTSTLSCELNEQDSMIQSTKYDITVKPAIVAEDGGKLTSETQSSFITQRPNFEYTSFNTWRSPSTPVIRLVFNQPISKSSIEQHIFMTSANSNNRSTIVAYPDLEYQKLPDYIMIPGEKTWLRMEPQQQPSDDQKTVINGEEARRVWLVEPSTPLPENSTITLKMEAGLTSAIGQQSSIENRDIITFSTFPDFKFAGIQCYSNDGKDILIAADNPDASLLCNPMRPVSLAFTSPVLRSEIKDNAVFSPDLAGGLKDYNPWGEESRDWSSLGTPHQKDRLYYIGLPVGLKAAQSYTLNLPAPDTSMISSITSYMGYKSTSTLEDEFGRTLSQPTNLTFATNHRNPNFEMPYHDVVLESGIDSEPPLYVNNLEGYTFNYRSISSGSAKESQVFTQKVNKISDIQYAVPTGVRQMLDGKSGAIFGYLSTEPPAPQKWEGDFRLFAQVTPWHAHLKLGHFSSLIWVTDLTTGKPAEGVTVTIYKDSYLTISNPKEIIATAITNTQGIAEFAGTEKLDPNQDFIGRWRDEDIQLFVRLDKDKDIGLLPLDDRFGLSAWSFSNDGTWTSNMDHHGHVKSWGMTAQGIYRAGDTMQYKIYLRHQNDLTLTPPPSEGNYTLQVYDPLGKMVHEIKNLKFSEFGAFSGEYKIPESASVGWYAFRLTADFSDTPQEDPTETDKNNANSATENEDSDQPQEFYNDGKYTLHPMRVLVSDFTPAPFKVTTEIGGQKFHPGDELNIESLATLHSGGAYGNAAVRTTITLSRSYFLPETSETKDFAFGSSKDGENIMQLLQTTEMLDDKGQWIEKFTLPQQPIYYGKLDIESAVQDDRGKSIASQASADYIGVDRFVGLKNPLWFYESKKPITLQTIVVDEEGKPTANSDVSVKIEYEDVSVAKVKGAGNAYLSDITREWKETSNCAYTSSDAAQDCTFTPEKAGTYRAVASITDTQGRTHETEITLWVSGDNYVQWNDQDNIALQIIAEKKDYKVGDIAKFLIKNPYPGATALISIERYGIIDYFTKTLEGSAPVIEIPIKADYLPGFYFSAIVTSPRVEAPLPKTGQVDMGKPAFRIGYVTVPIRDKYKEINVEAKPEKDVYQPRDKVKVSLKATHANTSEKDEPIELAVAVLDESVFDLIGEGKNAFDPYKGFYNLDPLDMRNYNLLYRLIERQGFDKKGANPGGDGGTDLDMRTLFKFVSYWNPTITTNKNGEAEIEFEAPDNLTGWRILAIATTPTDRMGLGEGNFKVNRPTEIRPAMPNQVREDDAFSAGFNIMNRTDKTRTLTVRIEASGDIADKNLPAKEETITLEPYKRTTVYYPLKSALLSLTREDEKGEIIFRASAADSEDSDAVEYKLPILKKRVLEVAANYATTTENKVEESIVIPKDIYTDTGDISVELSPSVITNLTGAFRYLRDYPYSCWEQTLTQGVMAAHYKELKSWLPDSFVWKQADTLTKDMLARAANYQAPNGSMTYFVATDAHADPYLSAYTALAFHWLKKDGYEIPADVESKLHGYLLNFLRQDAAPDFYQAGMTSTVRAVVLSALSQEGKATSEDVLRYKQHIKGMSLFGKAHYLTAALLFENTKPEAKETAEMIFAAGNETGGKLMYSEKLDDGYLRILSTPLRENCAILSAMIEYKTKGGKEADSIVGDKPFKLVRTITQTRGNRDHWENTQENIFCMNGLIDYARSYENKKPDMKIEATFGQTSLGSAMFDDFKDTPIKFTSPITDADSGQKRNLTLSKKGDGRLYYGTLLRYAPKSGWQNKVNAGMEISREYSIKKDDKWSLLSKNQPIKRGDNVRVDIYISLPAARNYIVVNDPIPGGLETVNRDLATSSSVDAAEASYDQAGGSMWFKFNDWIEYDTVFWSFYHQELRHDSARFYADWLPAGNYHLSYMTQAIADGEFSAPPTRIEEMYDLDIYGRGENASILVQTE